MSEEQKQMSQWEIEQMIEDRWMAEFKAYKDEHNRNYKRVVDRYSHMEHTCLQSLHANGQAMGTPMMEVTEEEKDILAEKAAELIRMGRDFERIIMAIKTEPTAQAAFDDFMMTLRLCGLDEIKKD